MDLNTINSQLAAGNIDQAGTLPHLDRLKLAEFQFQVDFGLDELPQEPGILMVRGARQYGKSTWLEQQIYQSICEFGAGSTYYINGDLIADHESLAQLITELCHVFSIDTQIKRLFIDEITAIEHWETALKRLSDNGTLRDVLVVTTGSKATDLRRGAEKLPGRKGKLDRTNYLFTPISFSEYKRVCGKVLGDDLLTAYLLSGGSPIACAELALHRTIPEYVITLVRDWVEGELAATKRTRQSLLNIMSVIYRFATKPVGQAKLAREAGLSNNSVAAGYIEILNDLGCITPAYPWDKDKHILVLRKPSKYHITNLLFGIAYSPNQIRSIADFNQLSAAKQGIWYEWLIAQELQRRAAIKGDDILAPLAFWQTNAHEIDFVASSSEYIEVKRGAALALEFAWFKHTLPKQTLTVINQNEFTAASIQGVNFASYLAEDYE